MNDSTLSTNGVSEELLALRKRVAELSAANRELSETCLLLTSRQQELEKLEERLRRYFDLGIVGMAVTSIDKGWVEVNERLCEILGYPKDELKQLTWADLTHPDDLAADVANFSQVLAGDVDGYSMEKRFIRKDGRVLHASISVKCLRRKDGTVDHFVAFLDDITSRQRSEHALRESEEKYRSLINDVLDASQVGVSILDEQLRVVWVNQAFEHFFDQRREDVIGMEKRELFQSLLEPLIESPEDFAHRALAPCQKISHIEQLTFRIRSGPGGHERWLDYWSQPIRAGLYAGGRIEHFYDITERRRAEETVVQERDFSQAVLDTVGSLVLVLDREGRIVEYNRACEELTGYSSAEVKGQGIWELLIPPEQLEAVKATFRELRSGQFPNRQRNHWLRKNGERLLVEWFNTAICDEHGDVEFVITTGMDVSQRVLAEEALRDSEERYRSLTDDVLETSGVAVMIIDAHGRVIWLNQAVERYFGVKREAMVGHEVQALIRDLWSQVFADAEDLAQRKLDAYRNQATLERLECHVAAAAGREERWLEHWSQPVRTGLYSGGRIEQYYDVTERKRAEQALVRAQKMEAIGQLISGVAHDFNNLLTVSMGNLELLERRFEMQTGERSLVRNANRALQRGAELTRKLLAFSRKQTLEPRPVNLNGLLPGVINMLRRTLGETIEIELMRGAGLWKAHVDPGQMETALVNLALNARDAMPKGGRLVMETANIVLDQEYDSPPENLAPGHYVKLSVSDSGNGMSPEVRERAFEPFFTTKPHGRGSGLGLSMVYGFARQSGGHVEIKSRTNFGTSVILYLPRSDRESIRLLRSPMRDSDYRGDGESVLIVEDDQAVRQLAVAFLEGLGYQVLAASNAAEALAIIDLTGEIDLLFSDLALAGGMNGSELAAEARQRNPKIRVLYASGHYTGSTALIQGADLLSKPYDSNDLARMAWSVLHPSVS